MSSFDLDLFDAVNDINKIDPALGAHIHVASFGVKEVRLKSDMNVHIQLIDDALGREWCILKGNKVVWGKTATQAMNLFLTEN